MKYLLFIGLLALISCSDEGIISNPNQIIFPTSGISYRQHVAPLMSVSCSMSGCHDAPRSQNNNRYFTSWVGVRGAAEPFDTTCPLIRVTSGLQPHWSGVLNINANHREGLKTWVLEGVLDN
ncbi:MAG TPA: hypothetical protein VIX80_04520 [Candidatus Kapabacteria bacterium]